MRMNLDVSFSQIAVFSADVAKPFSIWRDSHIAQGFVWRPDAVSFKTIIESGLHSVEFVIVEESRVIDEDTVRAIRVPFKVSLAGEIEIASVADGSRFEVAPGAYALTCEFLPPNKSIPRVLISLCACASSEFVYLRVDNQIRRPATIDVVGEPA